MKKLQMIKDFLLQFSGEPETFREYIIYERIKRGIFDIIKEEDES